MRISVDIDEGLMQKAMRSCGARTKNEAVEKGLRTLIAIRGQEGIRRFRGKVKWEGNLDVSRLGRTFSKRKSKALPLDVNGDELRVSTADLVAILKNGRKRR